MCIIHISHSPSKFKYHNLVVHGSRNEDKQKINFQGNCLVKLQYKFYYNTKLLYCQKISMKIKHTRGVKGFYGCGSYCRTI